MQGASRSLRVCRTRTFAAAGAANFAKVAEGLCVHRLAAPGMRLEVTAVAALHVKTLAPAEGRGKKIREGSGMSQSDRPSDSLPVTYLGLLSHASATAVTPSQILQNDCALPSLPF